MEVQIIVRDHDEAGGEAALLGVHCRQPGEECLAAAIAAAKELDGALAIARELQHAVQLAALALDADGEGLQATLRDGASTEAFEDVLGVSLAQGHGALSTPRLGRGATGGQPALTGLVGLSDRFGEAGWYPG